MQLIGKVVASVCEIAQIALPTHEFDGHESEVRGLVRQAIATAAIKCDELMQNAHPSTYFVVYAAGSTMIMTPVAHSTGTQYTLKVYMPIVRFDPPQDEPDVESIALWLIDAAVSGSWRYAMELAMVNVTGTSNE